MQLWWYAFILMDAKSHAISQYQLFVSYPSLVFQYNGIGKIQTKNKKSPKTKYTQKRWTFSDLRESSHRFRVCRYQNVATMQYIYIYMLDITT